MSLSNLEQLSRGFRRAADTSELREDEVLDHNDPSKLERFAPEVDENCFVVPLTVKKVGNKDQESGDNHGS